MLVTSPHSDSEAVSLVEAEPSDEALAAEAQGGSMGAFEELARRYQRPLLRFLEQRGPSPKDAEDVLQESMLRAYQSLGSYQVGRRFKPWLFTIAYRIAIDVARRKPSMKMSSENEPDKRLGPGQTAEQVDFAEKIWGTVRGSLGEEAYTAVWLCYADSLPPREIANVMGRSNVWVRTTLFRARKTLAVKLKEHDLGDGR